MPNHKSVASPTRICDLVMKGGITSGIVYPLAICELAEAYAFKNIGGTSAGAIAAAATAAAEYGRRQASPDATAFSGLAELPGWIGESGRLVDMFRPDRSTRVLFKLIMAAMNPQTPVGKIRAVSGQLLMHFPWVALFLVAAVVGIAKVVFRDITGLPRAYGIAATLVLALLVFVSVVMTFLYRQFTRTLPENFYGLSKACDPSAGPGDTPLTNWLTKYLNELAGKPVAEGLLTFGDLYGAIPSPYDPEERGDQY